MQRAWIFWLVCGSALSASAAEGIAYDVDPALTCPSLDQLRSAVDLQVGTPADPASQPLRRLQIRAGPGRTLVVALIDARSQSSFTRSIPQDTCAAQAEAVALLLRSWLISAAAQPEQPEPVRASVVSRIAPPAPEQPTTRQGFSWEPRLSVGGLVASTAAPLGGSAEGAIQLYLTRRWGLALRGAWFTPLHASDPSSPGSVDLRRYALGLDASWTGRPLPTAMDLALGLQDEIDAIDPRGYADENRAITHTLQIRLAVRYRLVLVGGLFAYAEASGTVGLWPRHFLADNPSGLTQLLAVPEVQIGLDLGLGWHFL